MLPVAEVLSLEETIEILSDPGILARVRTGANALQTGNYVFEEEFLADLGYPPASWTEGRWRLIVGGPARRAVTSISADSTKRAVLALLTGSIAGNPEQTGVELTGELARTRVAWVADQRVLFRVDTIQHAVRVIDVHAAQRFFFGG